jgi:hypothetical protein
VAELQEQATLLSARLDALQREVGTLRRDNEELKSVVAGFAGQLGQILQPLRRANDALVVAAEIVEQQRIQEIEHREGGQQSFETQRAEQARLAEAWRIEQQRLAQQLAAIEVAERRTLEGAEAGARELSGALEHWQEALRRELDGLRERVDQAAAEDRQATDRLAHAGEQARGIQDQVSRQLLGLNDLLREINQATRTALTEEETRAVRSRGDEAVRLNRVGLQHLARGNVEAAARLFAEAHAQAPDAFEPRLNLAVALLRSGRLAESAQLAGQLAATFPARPESAWVRGVARLALGDIERARADLAGVAAAAAGQEELAAAAGLAHLLAGDGLAALQALGAAARRPSHQGAILRQAGFDPGINSG